MQFTTTIATIILAATAVSAQGGVFHAVIENRSAGGCTGTADGEAVFGAVNLCQKLPTILTSVVSAKTLSVDAGCTVHLYTNAACTQGDTVAPVNACEQASAPFVAVNVKCP